VDPVSVRIASAYCADLVIGDPRWLPHPVRWLGWLIRRSESPLRRMIRNERLAGGLLVVLVCGVTLLVSGGLVWKFGAAAEVLLLFFCFSTKDLAVESWPVYQALRAGDLGRARRKVAWIVGRDTERLSEPEVVRAAVETIGESALDGIVSPLFYAALGGASLACLYKAVNTLDSMVGFRSARYIRFGQPAAVLDRWMNRIPAHLTALFLALAAQLRWGAWRRFLQRQPLRQGTGGKFFRAGYRDGWSSRENSYLTEAAMAGALGVQLGGTNWYQGVAAATPTMGTPDRPLTPERIREALQIMGLCSLLAVVTLLAAREIVCR
jgi:adenosylcobinamide-phosphate synthase